MRHAALVLRRLLIAAAAGLALADASVVTLALPELLRELHTTVNGVAAVLFVYAAVLALTLFPVTLVPAARLRARAHTIGGAGLALFTAASLICAIAGSLGVLLVGRALQAAGAAGALVAAFAFLVPADGTGGRRLWLGAAVFAAAAGPALGGALTEALSWEAIFFVQAPVGAAAAIACLTGRPPTAASPESQPSTTLKGSDPSAPARTPVMPAIALALLSAALTAVLFLLVLLLVAGWSVSPLRAAAYVTIIPGAALVGALIRADVRVRAATGCALTGAGVLALAFLPDDRIAWTFAPQVAAGLGMGLALPALAGGLLPERDARDAARALMFRHLGITFALVLLAPVASADLDDATQRARERGVALVLDARLPPQEKLTLAPDLLAGVEEQEPRAGLRDALAKHRLDVDRSQQAVYDRLSARTDETLVMAVGDAFRVAFLLTGAFALLAAALVVPRAVGGLIAGAAAIAVALPVAYALAHDRYAPEPVELHDPCKDRDLPSTGGLSGFFQDRALELLDVTACRLGSSREELVLALADTDDARRFEERHGTNPRSVTGLLSGLLGGG